MGNLLDVPIHRLMDRLSADTINAIQQPCVDTLF